jgi:cell division septation protein DedD
MKTTCRILSLVLIITLYTGCNSAIYEIVEVEEPVEIKPEKSPITDIKEDIKEEPKITENKFTDKQLVSKTYSIQIGAFNQENNASQFTDNARNILSGQEIYYKDIEGLYKVRLGNFTSKAEAIAFLGKIQENGFSDSFIVELTYYKVEK